MSQKKDDYVLCMRNRDSLTLAPFLSHAFGIKLHRKIDCVQFPDAMLCVEVQNNLLFYCHLELSKQGVAKYSLKYDNSMSL